MEYKLIERYGEGHLGLSPEDSFFITNGDWEIIYFSAPSSNIYILQLRREDVRKFGI